ncbi:tripartite tricarboxylate transporter TctB family protein [Oceanobacillus sp. CFH 90083]|uniref:tripartite tricarboxylate transporter TctB family protein n=1 Tax=Oceanobacillus sp. CFH 90083 TaxID=2592336 RepID=UPI001883D3F5|nr:tripartite tricarboxylate transporter TctB family protein [Oceanobacillus sp. CFH 90083]
MNKDYLNLIFSGFLFILFTLAWIEALTFSKLGQFFPLYISIAGSILTFIYLLNQLLIIYKQKKREGNEIKIPLWQPLKYIGWILGYLLLIYIGGLMAATAIFLILFLIFESKMKFVSAGISVICVLIAVSLLSSALDIYWPTNLLGL